jgi:hypothetical protein
MRLKGQIMGQRADIDMNVVRGVILDGQEAREGTAGEHETPTDKGVRIDREGQMTSPTSSTGDRSESTAPDSTFKAFGMTRHSRDQKIINKYLPKNSKPYTTPEGLNGWIYEIINEYNEQFQLFICFDGAFYQVYCITPEIDEEMRRGSPLFQNAHDGHIFEDARICMGDAYGSGWKDLRGAFTKSVIWSNGISYMLRSGNPFPFNAIQ